MIDFQIEMEKLFHKNQLIPRIRQEFKKESDFFEPIFKEASLTDDFGYDLLVQVSLHRRVTIDILVGILRKHYQSDVSDGCQDIADAILRACEANLMHYNPTSQEVITRFQITDDLQEELDRYQYPLPMVVPPLPLRTNKDTGYYTHKGSVILRDNHHNQDVCLDHLEKLNSIKFRLNMDVATTIKNKWRNLDKQKPDETRKDYEKRYKAFEKYDRTAHDVLLHLGIATGGEFYLTHKYDKRGRTYCQGYHVSYMAAPWNKAVIEFANQEVTK